MSQGVTVARSPSVDLRGSWEFAEIHRAGRADATPGPQFFDATPGHVVLASGILARSGSICGRIVARILSGLFFPDSQREDDAGGSEH